VVELHVDHVIPVSLGGTNEPWNLVAACVPCNLGKANYAPAAGLVRRVRQEWVNYSSPRTRPVILCTHCGIPVILPEGEEAATQCASCMEARIDAYMMGANA
jgi:5-methylcytosine-specific restriction endonuclease McrA